MKPDLRLIPVAEEKASGLLLAAVLAALQVHSAQRR